MRDHLITSNFFIKKKKKCGIIFAFFLKIFKIYNVML